jgi:hypothetical protein
MPEQDGQCTYNVTLKSVGVTIFAVEKQKILHILSACVCVCSLSYPVRNAHAPYYIILSGCSVFFHIISKKERFSERSY